MAQDLAADIRDRLSVEDVVGGYVELKRSGRSLKALSPFQPEKTPSLIVTPDKQIWKDFSSGQGGDIFSFVMAIEGVEFKEALDILATKAGLDPAQYRRSGLSKDKKDKLYQALGVAQNFYRESLKKNRAAGAYIRQRKFDTQVINDFGVGYAPSGWKALANHLKTKKIDPKVASKVGLIKERTGGWGDLFVDRLMVPLMDTQGTIIGFTGRALKADEKQPKYINSPQTPLYNKSRHIFGFSQAKIAIRQAGYVVVVEGNLDVIASHRVGIKEVVAAGGTAITDLHLKQLSRLTTDIRLAFDGDSAGTEATKRIIHLSQSIGVKVSIIDLPKNQDPDDLINKKVKAWSDLIAKPIYSLDWLYDQYKSKANLKTAVGKKDFTDLFLKVVASLLDPVEKTHYLDKLAAEGLERSALDKKLETLEKKSDKQSTPRVKKAYKMPSSAPIIERQERLLLGFLLKHPPLRAELSNSQIKEQKQVADYLKERYPALIDFLWRSNQEVRATDLPPNLQSEKKNVKLAETALNDEEDGRYAKILAKEPAAQHKQVFQTLISLLSRQVSSVNRNAKKTS